MKFLLKLKIPNETGNRRIASPDFGEKMKEILHDIKAEAAYFGTVDGCRGGYIVVNVTDASQIPSIGEPLFLYFGAEIEMMPVMTPEDLGKAGPSIGAAVQKWSDSVVLAN